MAQPSVFCIEKGIVSYIEQIIFGEKTMKQFFSIIGVGTAVFCCFSLLYLTKQSDPADIYETTTRVLSKASLYCKDSNICLITLESVLQEGKDLVKEEPVPELNSYAESEDVPDPALQTEEPVWEIEESELDILQRIVEAEAGGEDLEGKMLVANVVLNRVKEDAFPDTITEVVYQNRNGTYQFSPVKSGRIDRVEVSEETVEAVGNVLQGEDSSEGALYFVARKHADKSNLKWFENKLKFLFRHGGHEFYK